MFLIVHTGIEISVSYIFEDRIEMNEDDHDDGPDYGFDSESKIRQLRELVGRLEMQNRGLQEQQKARVAANGGSAVLGDPASEADDGIETRRGAAKSDCQVRRRPVTELGPHCSGGHHHLDADDDDSDACSDMVRGCTCDGADDASAAKSRSYFGRLGKGTDFAALDNVDLLDLEKINLEDENSW